MADHRLKKSKKGGKKKGEDSLGNDVRLHKANSAHKIKKLLLEIEDHNPLDKNGDTPLHSFVRRRDKEKFNCLMAFLIHSKCDVNLPNREGQTALHLACEDNDMKMIKALIAFDARINSVNNSYSTPLDIVLDNDYHSVKDLLIQLGAMTSDEMGCTVDDDSYDDGRVSPYTEVDLASRHLKDSEYYHFQPISLANGYDLDPGIHDEVDSNNSNGDAIPYPSGLPINGGASPPPGGLNCHHEEEEDPMFMTANPNDPLFTATRGGEDALFMTARQDLFMSTTESEEPVFMTAGPHPILTQVSVELKEGHTDEVSPDGKGNDDNSPMCTNQVSASSDDARPAKDDPTPNSLEGSLQMTLTSPISPGASLEMGLTLTKLLRQRHLVGSAPEQSVLASWSSSIVQENHFLPEESSPWLQSHAPSSLPSARTPNEELHLDRETQMANAYGEIYSTHKGFPWGNGLSLEETDGDSLEQQRASESPVTQSPTTHSPIAQSPKSHSPSTHSPVACSPTTHSPIRHSPVEHSPIACSPTVRSPVITVSQSPVESPPSKHSPISHSPRTQSPLPHSPEMQAQTSHSPPSKSPVMPAPTSESPSPQSPRAHSPVNSAANLPIPLPRRRAQTSPGPGLVSHQDHGHSPHVRFEEQSEKESEALPLSQKQGGVKKKKKKRIDFRSRVTTDGPTRSLSTRNSDMDVMASMIGHSVVHRTQKTGQKILCLDGGGVKGLIQIEMLRAIEQLTGKSILDLFDWIVGTSTGGILALGMIYGGLSLSELRRYYFEMKDTVFKQQSKFVSHTCDTNALEELLKRMLGTDTRMDCVEKPNVLITAVDKTTTRLPVVFFNNCFEHVERRFVRNEYVWKAARYTSAAPIFFAECDNYVDGGVIANNPTTYALPEIQDFLTRKHGRGSSAARVSCVVSLGCGIYPPEPLGNTDIVDALKITRLYSAPRRLGDLLTLLTTALGGSEQMSRLCQINCEHQGISYFRFSPEIGEDVGTTEKDSTKLCEIIIRAKALFIENADQVKEMVRALGYQVQEDYLYHL